MFSLVQGMACCPFSEVFYSEMSLRIVHWMLKVERATETLLWS